MGILAASRTVMNAVTSIEDGEVTYLDEDLERSHAITWQQYLDMGRPAQITVTVEPGDRLN